jgi:CHAT domain-containing protein
VVGGVDYGPSTGSPRADWGPLPGTREEAESVARIFRVAFPGEEVDLLLGAEASEPKLRERITRRRFAHLATHGFFRPGAAAADGFATFGPLSQFDSGVVLAGVNRAGPDDPDDQVLTADEVGTLDLSGVELVVLSACESALGHISEGQGVIGLIGALDRARAAAVVSALWKVEDRATAAFMASFYRHLWSGAAAMGPAQALRLAQREMARGEAKLAAGVPTSHPQSWAAFVVTGDPFPRPQAAR